MFWQEISFYLCSFQMQYFHELLRRLIFQIDSFSTTAARINSFFRIDDCGVHKILGKGCLVDRSFYGLVQFEDGNGLKLIKLSSSSTFSRKSVIKFNQASPNVNFWHSLFSYVYNTQKNANIVFFKFDFSMLIPYQNVGGPIKCMWLSLHHFAFQVLNAFLYNIYLINLKNLTKTTKMRKFKWTQEEEEFLKFLREEKSMKSWKSIALEINRRFPESLKSSKQCREKYINYSRFCGTPRLDTNQKWSESDDQKLSTLYNEFGSTWSSFTHSLTEKSENSIKNRFYNRLKKLAKKLDDHRMQHSEQIRGTSSYDSMIRILDFSNQVKSFSVKNNVSISSQSALMKTRQEILYCCFTHGDDDNIPCEDLCRLTRKMKEVNIKIRCFGICKAKNRKNWKLTKRGFDSTLLFDQQPAANLKVENQDQKLVDSQAGMVSEDNQKQYMKYSTENEQYLQYYSPYYYMPPYYMMPPPMAIYPPQYQEYQEYPIKLQQEIQNYKQFSDFTIKEQQK